MKGIFFHRFDIAFHAEPRELKNTWMCQLWHVGRLRVNQPPLYIDSITFNLLDFDVKIL